MKIVVFGWYGNYNLGDESYRMTIPNALGLQHEYRFVNFLNSFDIDWCDIVILGGGNILKPDFTKQLLNIKKPIYGLSVGIESDKLPHDISFKHIWARDKASVAILKNSGVSCSFLPDLGLMLQGNAESGKRWLRKQFDANGLELYNKVGVVVINNYLLNGRIDGLARNAFAFMDFSYKMARVLDETSASFVFLSFGTKPVTDDRITNGWIYNTCKWWKKNYLCYDRLSVQETLDVIAASDVVVSSRLHSSVFAYGCGVPFVDITHHSKNTNFLETFGHLDSRVSFWDFDGTLARRKIASCIEKGRNTEVNRWRLLIQKELNAISFG